MFDARGERDGDGTNGRTWVVGAWLDRLIASFHGPLILYRWLWLFYEHPPHRRNRALLFSADREAGERRGENCCEFTLMGNDEEKAGRKKRRQIDSA